MSKPELRVIYSSGEPGTGIFRYEDGRSEEFQRRATPCGGCKMLTIAQGPLDGDPS